MFSYMKHVTLEILTAPHCAHCDELLRFWESIKGEWPNVEMQEVDILSEEGRALTGQHFIFASPGVLLNGELFASGNIDHGALKEKLRSISAS